MNVDPLLKNLASLETYPNTKDYRVKVLKGDKTAMEQVQFVVCQTLCQPSATPLSKLMAVRLAKDCMETFNDDFISQSQETILARFEELALFNKEFKDDNRGRHLFSDNPNQEQARIGNSILRLVLECLWVWAKWFPVDPDTQCISVYKLTVEKLVKIGVKFPKIIYFEFGDVTRSMPDNMVPLNLLSEVRSVIQDDIHKTQGVTSPSRKLANSLYTKLEEELQRKSNKDIYYSDRIRRALKNKPQQQEGEQEPENQSRKTKLHQSQDVQTHYHIDPKKLNQYQAQSQAQLKAELREMIKKKQHLEHELSKTDEKVFYLKTALKGHQQLSVPQTNAATHQNSPTSHEEMMRTPQKRGSLMDSTKRSNMFGEQLVQPQGQGTGLSFTSDGGH